MNQTDIIWRNQEFRLYLGSTGFSGIAFAMQQLLLAWILIGILELPATQVGVIQAAVGIPGIFLMLLGGARADGVDPRILLFQVYSLAPLLPLFLIAIISFEQLGVLSVLLWGLGMSAVVSYSSPAQQTILNRVASSAVQKAVSAATAIGFMVQMLGLAVAGTMDALGLIPVLSFQALCIILGAFAVRRLNPQVPIRTSSDSALNNILSGLRAVYRHKVILQALTINFVSSIFNAGTFMTVFPFIIKRVYDGDALLLSLMMIIFYGGATASNFIMIRLMPLTHPGKIFLIMQFSRMLILGIIWINPSFWLFALATIGWGLNMGVTTTLARTIVQESASEEYRARILSVYSLGLLGSPPIGALILGWIIESFGTLNALVPAMCISIALFLYGVFWSDVYKYESPIR